MPATIREFLPRYYATFRPSVSVEQCRKAFARNGSGLQVANRASHHDPSTCNDPDDYVSDHRSANTEFFDHWPLRFPAAIRVGTAAEELPGSEQRRTAAPLIQVD